MAALQNQLLLWSSSDPQYLTFEAFLLGKLLSSSEKWRLRNLGIFAGFLDPNRSEVQWLGLRYPNVHLVHVHSSLLNSWLPKSTTKQSKWLSIRRLCPLARRNAKHLQWSCLPESVWSDSHCLLDNLSQVASREEWEKNPLKRNCQVLDTTWLAFEGPNKA